MEEKIVHWIWLVRKMKKKRIGFFEEKRWVFGIDEIEREGA